jgi:aminopeptidase Y
VTGLGDYYDVTNQTFPAVSGNVFESRLVLGHNVLETARPMGLTPPTKNKEPVYGQLTLVANQGCDEADYPSDLAGAIALIERGTCPFGTKSELAGRAGAVAAVVYNNEQGEVSGTLGTPSPNHVATFGISDADAAPFVKQLKEGKKVDSIAYIDATVDTIHTTNIIAQTKGGDPQNCVMLGGHSDSVAEGPGINDDGSGSTSLLEIATQLSKYSVNNCVRFAWWAAEEEGLLGSDYYVSVLSEEENLKIRLFMDYDMLASPNFAYQVYNATNAVNPVGSEELRELYTEWYTAHGLNFTYIPFDGRSDYDAFIRNGIPGGGIATGAEGVKSTQEQAMFGGVTGDWYDPCYHQLCDDLGNVNATAWEINSKVFGQSPPTFTVKLTMCTFSWLLTLLQRMLFRLTDFQRGPVSAATQWSSRNASTTDLSFSCNLDRVYCGVVVFTILILNLIHSDISHSIFTYQAETSWNVPSFLAQIPEAAYQKPLRLTDNHF